jgi:DivIVA domain-containing protein
VTLILVVVAIGIVAGVAVLIARDRPLIAEDPVSASRLSWPPAGVVRAGDLDAARFTVALRGYRMDEVDRVLDDAAAALAARDRRIAELEGGRSPGTVGATPQSRGAEPPGAAASAPPATPDATETP